VSGTIHKVGGRVECPDCGCSVFNDEARCMGCGWSAGRVITPVTPDLRIALAHEANDTREALVKAEEIIVALAAALRQARRTADPAARRVIDEALERARRGR
jgi:hypothetical protein